MQWSVAKHRCGGICLILETAYVSYWGDKVDKPKVRALALGIVFVELLHAIAVGTHGKITLGWADLKLP